MNKKDYLEKTKKLARITRILCRIGIIASAIGVGILAVTVIVAYVLPPERIKPMQEGGKLSIFLTDNLFIPADVLTSVEALRGFLMALLARISVGIAVFIVAAFHLMGLLKSVENGAPFEPQNVTRLRKIGVVLMIGSIIVPTVTSVSAILMADSNLLDIKANSMIDITLLLCGLLIIVLAGIFAYGARLQREHDQTV